MTQYQKDLVRMWDSMRIEYKGSHNCCPILCAQCPLNEVACSGDGITHTIFNAEKAIEIVAQWAKEHPIATRVAKFKEVFGVEPKDECGHLICPHFLGFTDVECVYGVGCKDCKRCKNEFWYLDEYIKPEKDMGEL